MKADYSKSFEYKQLLNTVEKFYGQSIENNSDCIILSDKIENYTNIQISSQTLRRLFGLVETKSKPLPNTLNTLSKYVGFDDYKSFCQYINRQPSDTKVDLNHIVKAYKYNLNEEILSNRTYFHEHFSVSIAKFLIFDESRFTEIITSFNNNPLAIRHLIESCIGFDLLGKDWFMRGMRLFCRNSPLYHHKLFIKSIEFQSNWLLKKYDKAGLYLNDIESQIEIMRKKHGAVWPLEGCLYAERIAWANYQKDFNKIELLVDDAKLFIADNHHFIFEEMMDVNIFYYVFLDSLNWGGVSHIGLRFIDNFNSMNYNHHSLLKTSIKSTFQLRLSFMYALIGDLTNAQKQLSNFELDKLEEVELNCNLILYNIVLLKLEKRKIKANKLRNEINRLIELTGFTHYLDFIK